MMLDVSSHATFADGKRGGVLWSKRVMTGISMVDGWVTFRPLYRERCLGNLVMSYVGQSGRIT